MSAPRLGNLLSRLLSSPSPFYRERLRAAGITSEADAAGEWMQRVPPTRRDELVRDQVENLPHGTRRFADAVPPVRAGKTGTGSNLLVLAYSAADLTRERAAGVRMLRRLGVRPGMRVANALPGGLVTPGALLWGDVIEQLGGLDVPLGPVESKTAAEQAWSVLDLVEPDVLVATPRSAEQLFASAAERERPWWKGILWLGAPSQPLVAPDVPAGLGFCGWQRTWLAVPEASSFVAVSCSAGALHVDDEVLVETSQGGTLLLTAFGFDAPVLRYVSELRANVSNGACACGEEGVILRVS